MTGVEKWAVILGCLIVVAVIVLLFADELDFDRNCLHSHQERRWVGKMVATVRVCDEWR